MGQTADELRREVAARRADISRDLDAIGDKVSPGRAIERRTESAKRRWHGMREAVMGSAEDTAASTAGAIGHVGDRMAEAPEMAKQRVQGNPLAAGMIAFGAGLLVASLLPPSRREQEMTRMAEGGLQRAAEQVRESGQQVMSDLRDDTREAVGQVREVAGDAASAITEQTRESADHLTDDARKAAENVAGEARGTSPGTQPGDPGIGGMSGSR
jgi:cell division septum initiation protein DivIVA